MSANVAPKKSWKTTACGIAGAVAALLGLVVVPLLDEDPATVPMWAEFLPIALTSIGLGAARDHKVSSAAAGVDKPVGGAGKDGAAS